MLQALIPWLVIRQVPVDWQIHDRSTRMVHRAVYRSTLPNCHTTPRCDDIQVPYSAFDGSGNICGIWLVRSFASQFLTPIDPSHCTPKHTNQCLLWSWHDFSNYWGHTPHILRHKSLELKGLGGTPFGMCNNRPYCPSRAVQSNFVPQNRQRCCLPRYRKRRN